MEISNEIVEIKWLEIYGEDRFVVMFGGLHIEMAAFKLLGDLLKGTGWVTALSEADIASLGTAESFLTEKGCYLLHFIHGMLYCGY
jgi:hypothetical protein